jgi:hypothetical protein
METVWREVGEPVGEGSVKVGVGGELNMTEILYMHV